ncbi:MAG TPA: hypothetical protein V6D17_04595 [Candidatus Obscuribacterales bacterium]
MNFLSTLLRSGVGAAVGLFIYALLTNMLVFGTVPLLGIVISSLVVGTIFGLIYSVVHLKREPTFGSSVATGIGFAGLATVIALAAGTFAGFSIASIIGIAVFGVLIGSSSFLGMRSGK